MMDMPTPCPGCREIVEFEDMVNHPNEFKTMVCEECHDRIEEENNSGIHVDSYKNKLSWTYTPDDGVLEIYFNNRELTTWVCEGEPEELFNDFLKIWSTAQEAVTK